MLCQRCCNVHPASFNQLAKETSYSRGSFARNSSRQKTPTTESPPSVKQSRTTSNPERCSFVASHPNYNLMCAEQTFTWLLRYKKILCSMNKTHHCFFPSPSCETKKYLYRIVLAAGRICTTVVAFGSILMQIAGASSPGAVTEDAILDSALLASVTYNNGGVVTAFRRESIE